MTKQEARRIIGNQPKWVLRNMIRALQMYSWLNTEAEWQRLRALRALGFKITIDIPDATA